MKKLTPSFSLLALTLALMTPAVHAQSANIKDAAGKAVLTNPEVRAKWDQFKAAGFERDAAWGRYLPSLDFVIGVADERKTNPSFAPNTSRSYSRDGQALTLQQNLFDGFATTNETRRLDHATLVRYHELLEVSEAAALEATKAYIDIYRYQKLVELAEENYATHRVVYEQIKERVEATVGRRVDLEVAFGRLSLAESNLLTEVANLHDVTARYQRIVGDLPGKSLAAPSQLKQGLPGSSLEAVKKAYQDSPQLKAAMENIIAAQRNVEVQKGNNWPRVDLKAETFRGHDLDGVSGQHKTDVIELTAKWNLFNGFSDKSRTSQAAENVNVAKDLRDKVCRDIRQTTVIAQNDTRKLAEQLAFLDQHQLSTDKAREAFRKQFDIGQRTLLDLLDTENEYYEARRAYVNGEQDLALSFARTHAATGNLLKTLGLKPLEANPPETKDDAQDAEDTMTRCPVEAPTLSAIDKNALFERAMAKSKLQRQAPVAAEPKVITIFAKSLFEFNKADLNTAAKAEIDKEVIAKLGDTSKIKLTLVGGHTDSMGSVAFNKKLSEKRAQAVKAYLVSKGMDGKKIKAVGYGSTQPAKDAPQCDSKLPRNKLIECLEPHRRVTVEIQTAESASAPAAAPAKSPAKAAAPAKK